MSFYIAVAAYGQFCALMEILHTLSALYNNRQVPSGGSFLSREIRVKLLFFEQVLELKRT